MLRILSIIVLLAGVTAHAFEQDEFKAYLIKRAAPPPVIDGSLDDECWKSAERLSGFVKLGGSIEAAEPTSFQAAYDNENLYIAVECREPDIAKIVAKCTQHDEPVFGDDCIEIFIDPRHDHADYFQFAVNAAGTQYEAKRLDSSWNAPWQAKTKIAKSAWYLEIAIPWASLKTQPPKQGVMGFNVCRTRQAGGLAEYSSWTMLDRFHVPAWFGHLVFGGGQLLLSKEGRDKLAVANKRADGFDAFVGRDLVNCKDPAKWRGTVKINTEQMRSGKGCFELFDKTVNGKAVGTEIESELIPIDTNKTYRLSCYMRSLDGTNLASGWFGLRMYDKDQKPITLMNLQFTKDSETRLAAPVVKGARELWIESNPKWTGGGRIAFNIKDNYADLPNMDISQQIKDVVDEGQQRKVILQGPLSGNYPAGTRVRLHGPYAACLYWIAGGWMPTEWMECFTFIKGEAPMGCPATSFWKGTKYVKVYSSFGNYNAIPKPGAVLLVDDIHFVEEP